MLRNEMKKKNRKRLRRTGPCGVCAHRQPCLFFFLPALMKPCEAVTSDVRSYRSLNCYHTALTPLAAGFIPPKQILARTANKLPGHIVYVPLLMSELHMFVFMLRTPLNTYFLLMWAHSLFRLVFPSPLPLLYILPAFII